MKSKYIFVALVVFLASFYSCSDQPFGPGDYLECPKIQESRILTEEERLTECYSESVYFFQSEFYFVCDCCLCYKRFPPISCDGKGFDISTDEGLAAFFNNAEYLFNIVEE